MAKPPRIVLLNGVVDNRENMLDESAEQYSEDEANYPELLLNQGWNSPTKLVLELEIILTKLLLKDGDIHQKHARTYFHFRNLFNYPADGLLPLQSASVSSGPN